MKIGGEEWAAIALDEDETFGPGDLVDIVEITGATAHVIRSYRLGGANAPRDEKGE